MKLLRNRITVGILIASQFMYGMPAYSETYTSDATQPANGHAPVASNLAFDKVQLAIGDTVTLSYDFQDVDGDLEQGTTVRWLRNGEAIQGATSFSYTLEEAKGDKPAQRLSVEVTPKTNTSSSEPAVGPIASLEAIVVGDPLAKPVVDVTDITGTLQVGQSLTGVYSYDANGTGSADASIKAWLNGGHASTDLTYDLDAADVGKVLTFQVQAFNKAGTEGNTDKIDTATATGVNGGGQITPGEVVDPLAKPVVSDLKISGTLNVGENLSGRYSYDPNGTGSNDASTYVWGYQGATAATVGDGDSVQNTGSVPPYTIRSVDAGQVLEVSVEAKNLAGAVGN
ncbi:hypothetical protein, partial [Pseudomonas fluorescens]|uniref:hypothetical protein n=1 Tax=Pseudomonas fluorescens TaxID=294 RepID=UPI000CD3950D